MKQTKIKEIKARQIINGRGIPAVEVEVITENEIKSIASGPSGTSTSTHEAIEVRDHGERLMGKGVQKAVDNIIDLIAPKLKGMDVTDQVAIDDAIITMDGTKNKSKLGGNATTALSLAVAKCAALNLRLPLYQYLGGVAASMIPIICPNMLSGSKTAGNKLDFEDYLLVPYGFATIKEAIFAGIEVFHTLHKKLTHKYGLIPQITALAPPISSTEEAFDFILSAIEEAGYKNRIGLAVDVAAGLFYSADEDVYCINNKKMSKRELIGYYKQLVGKYPIILLEDGLEENDYEGFSELTKETSCITVGDDLYGTNLHRLLEGAKRKSTKGALFKVNQVGTVTEFLKAAQLARANNYSIVASVRSGETDDSAQVDLAVAIGAKFMKVGAPIRGEMITKYNRFLQIEEELGKYGDFWGKYINL